MNFTTTPSKVRSIRQGDPNFMIEDGFISYPRAMIHVLPECPTDVQEMINWAMAVGYIKCVAHITERELIFMGLANE